MISKLRQWTRARRRRLFEDFLPPARPLRIIDLGGTVPFWRAFELSPAHGLHVTLINTHANDTTAAGFSDDSGLIDDRDMDANDVTIEYLRSFDLIFSNSFLEHLSAREQQAVLAGKISASGVSYFIQTPNKFSPVDPHFPSPLAPFFAAYPRPLQAWMLSHSRLGSGAKSRDFADAMDRLRYYNPLGLGDMRAMFPDAQLLTERPAGVPMSVIARCARWKQGAANANGAPSSRPEKPVKNVA